MIVVTVGNASQPFPRLLEGVDAVAERGLFRDEQILVQAGHTPFRSRNCTVVRFLSMDDFVDAVGKARILICHGGAGTLHHAFGHGKIPVVMPRRVPYGEHVDDQLELVRALAAGGRVIPAYEPEDLPSAIEQAFETGLGQSIIIENQPALIGIIAAVLHELLSQT